MTCSPSAWSGGGSTPCSLRCSDTRTHADAHYAGGLRGGEQKRERWDVLVRALPLPNFLMNVLITWSTGIMCLFLSLPLSLFFISHHPPHCLFFSSSSSGFEFLLHFLIFCLNCYPPPPCDFLPRCGKFKRRRLARLSQIRFVHKSHWFIYSIWETTHTEVVPPTPVDQFVDVWGLHGPFI